MNTLIADILMILLTCVSMLFAAGGIMWMMQDQRDITQDPDITNDQPRRNS